MKVKKCIRDLSPVYVVRSLRCGSPLDLVSFTFVRTSFLRGGGARGEGFTVVLSQVTVRKPLDAEGPGVDHPSRCEASPSVSGSRRRRRRRRVRRRAETPSGAGAGRGRRGAAGRRGPRRAG